jgi:dipeptidyl aminopeptidase/acylaminoacyl peptidase
VRVYPKDEDYARDYERVREALPTDGDVYFISASDDEAYRLVSLTSDTDPGATYLFSRESGEIDLLYRPRPRLPVEHLAPMQPVRYIARDGLEIPGYLTLPLGKKPENLPLVVNPHGGPWARDTWGYRATVQFLANRGYAVFQPNFRGSSGFGKEFLNAGNHEWGTGYMQHDITDGVKHLINEGIADPERIGIMGGSYGGYATLAGVAFTPDLYAAGVSIVGPSNIITLLNKDFLKLVLLGFVIATPIAWYAMNRWLEDFAYRIEIGPGVFLLAGLAALLIALATVSWQSVKAALVNPVESLRTE